MGIPIGIPIYYSAMIFVSEIMDFFTFGYTINYASVLKIIPSDQDIG